MTRQQLILLYRQYDPDAEFYTWEQVLDATRRAYPDWPDACVQAEADRVFADILAEEAAWFRSQQRFFDIALLTSDVDATLSGQHPDAEDEHTG